ncbi:MAG TPA: zinc-dependent metalloprotease [Acidimicrobiia bacterium]|nr:zinc-dependent metalloprotease [Acidimicrobiia bacterium]
MTDRPQPGDPDEPDKPERRDESSPSGFPGMPFGGGGFDLAQIMRMLQTQGPINWDVARQIAAWVAVDGGTERPIDPAAHAQLEELTRAAETHVVGETDLTGTYAASLRTLGPQGWAALHLDALRPVLEALATTLGKVMREAGPAPGELESGEPGPAGVPGASPFGPEMLGGMMQMLAPALLGMQAGSMIGYLAQHALGRYDLPLPTSDKPSLCFVVQNIDNFEEAWSLDRADLRFYVAVHEVVHAAERSVAWVRERLVRLSTQYVSAYEVDPSALEDRFGSVDPADPSTLGSIAEDPEALLGAMHSARQDEPRRQLQLLTSVLEGYADSVLERVGAKLIPSFRQIHEAMERHRVERGEAEVFIEGLLGLKLERHHYEQGAAFCRGVIDRAGPEGLNRLWESERMLPTPAELDAPGLWLARIELPDAT